MDRLKTPTQLLNYFVAICLRQFDTTVEINRVSFTCFKRLLEVYRADDIVEMIDYYKEWSVKTGGDGRPEFPSPTHFFRSFGKLLRHHEGRLRAKQLDRPRKDRSRQQDLEDIPQPDRSQTA